MGRTSERGYGTSHQRLRKSWARQVEQGVVACARCGRQILPGTPWDLDHSPDRSGYLGPSHRRCNRSTAKRRQPARRASAATVDYRDDPDRGVYWGPPNEPGRAPQRWSRHWFDWRTEELERRDVAE
jgi:hypothetical protein